MKVALDPYMFRTTPLLELPALVAELGYRAHRAVAAGRLHPVLHATRGSTPATIKAFRTALDDAGVEVASLLPLFRWSGPDEDERQAAVRYWRRSIEIAVELGRERHELGVQRAAGAGRAVRGDVLAVDGRAAADLRAGGDRTSASSPTPTTSSRTARSPPTWSGASTRRTSATCTARRTRSTWAATSSGILRHAGDLVTHVHVADSFDHRASSGLRYILNPPGTTARVHQHLDIGQGEVDWDAFFGTLGDAALRRHHDRMRVRLGGSGPGVQPRQSRGDPAPDGVLDPSRLSRRRRP